MEKFPSYLKLGADSQTSDFAQYTAFKWTLSLHVSGKWFTVFVKRMYMNVLWSNNDHFLPNFWMCLHVKDRPKLMLSSKTKRIHHSANEHGQICYAATPHDPRSWDQLLEIGHLLRGRSKARGHWMATLTKYDKILQQNSSKFFRAAWKRTATWLVLASRSWSCPKHTFDVHRFLRFPEDLKGFKQKTQFLAFRLYPWLLRLPIGAGGLCPSGTNHSHNDQNQFRIV